jgi:DNA-binding transcriptional ArsR family regulator
MNEGPNFAEVGALIGDPARANILAALMDGRALTATELSYIAGVSPQTASGHLAKLTEARLLALESQGRHRYYRLSGPEVAQALEALMVLATNGPPRHRPPGPRDEAMRMARTCYDHLAGRLGVGITQGLLERGFLAEAGKTFELTPAGVEFLTGFGVDLDAAHGRRRAFARSCLDWSERRSHLGGALGAAVAARCFELGWLRRAQNSRTVLVTETGQANLREAFALTLG